MDPLTHCLVGVVAAKSVRASRRRFWIMVALGGLPDLDFVFFLFGDWAWAFQHRGLSHSLVGVVAQAGVLAWMLGRWDRGSYGVRFWHYTLPLGLHVFGDYLTSYGVPLFAPFSFKAYTADLTVALSVAPMVFMMAGLWWMRRRGATGWRAARPVWAAWVVYLAVCSSAKVYAGALATTVALPGATLPSMANPFAWRVVHVDQDGAAYRHYMVNVLRARATEGGVLPALRGDFPVEASLGAREVQRLFARERWPVARVTAASEAGWTVEWGMLLFSTKGPVRGIVEVGLDKDGHIVHEERIYSFWGAAS